MPKPVMSKSGLFEILRVNVAKSKFDSTEVEIRIPKFQNFGLGLAERERQAEEYEKQLEAEMTPEEVTKAEAEADAAIADMAKTMRDGAAASKMELDQMADGKKKEALNLLAKMMEDAAAMMEEEPEKDASEAEEPPTESTGSPEDFEALTVLPDEEIPWDAEAEARIDEFIQSWPKIRPQLLKKAHAYYAELYPELKDIFSDMPTFKFTMPKPTSAKAIEDIFSISTIYLRDDGTIGLSGSCTWDEEHGFGAVIKKGKVVTFGHASDGFC